MVCSDVEEDDDDDDDDDDDEDDDDYGRSGRRKSTKKTKRKKQLAFDDDDQDSGAYEVRFSSRNKTQANYDESAIDAQWNDELGLDDSDEDEYTRPKKKTKKAPMLYMEEGRWL
jgi:hypothetical protein